MAHQRAGDTGKPSIHIGDTDSKLATELGVEDDSPSSVYSDALEKWKKYEKIKDEEVKEAKSEIISIVQEIENRHGIERNQLLEKIVEGEIV